MRFHLTANFTGPRFFPDLPVLSFPDRPILSVNPLAVRGVGSERIAADGRVLHRLMTAA